jgi:hypothetical protein
MTAQHNAAVTGEPVDGMKHLVPAVLRQQLNQCIEADHRVFFQAVEDVNVQALEPLVNRRLSLNDSAVHNQSSSQT